MKSCEKYINSGSEYFIHTPSSLGEKLFFYPLVIGHFYYSKEYFLHRSSFHSFLLMYVKRGTCTVCSEQDIFNVAEGQAVLLDCHRSHAYYSEEGWEALWLHFDGGWYREYWELAGQKKNAAIEVKSPLQFESNFNRLYQPFCKGEAVKEIQMSQWISELLTELILVWEKSEETDKKAGVIEESLRYIRENLMRALTLEELADHVGLSKFYFTRIFKKETGFTPYEYILRARMEHAKYLLNGSNMAVKEIGFLCGFTSESGFCNTFRKRVGCTPGEFREGR